MEVDVLLADILTNEFNISADRVVIYNQNFVAPSDDELYIIVKIRDDKIISSKIEFDESSKEEVKSVVIFTRLNIILTSKNESAKLRKHEAITSLKSYYSEGVQQQNNIKIMRIGDILDGSFVEGSSSLYRYIIPVMISSVEIKRTSIDYYDKFRDQEIVINRR
ncbi:hypothetical protein GF396_04525 [Candidatus Pacearchaeota archaeon]|nr:hypothetical protein [Candidatus Pacearchaeota archaeon]